jgi:tetrahydromethanopterin S-methyltransferase subunit E
MPDQFVVPQFLDVEAKIIGPITGRQFILLLIMIGLDFLIYRIVLNAIIAIPLMLIASAICLMFAFAKVNGQAFHFIALNMIQTLRRPGLRIWDKKLNDSELKDRMKPRKEEEVKEVIPKPRELSVSRLNELSLLVNTGGAFDSSSVDIHYGQES